MTPREPEKDSSLGTRRGRSSLATRPWPASRVCLSGPCLFLGIAMPGEFPDPDVNLTNADAHQSSSRRLSPPFLGPFIPSLGIIARADKWWETQAQLLHIVANSLTVDDRFTVLVAKDMRRALIEVALECFSEAQPGAKVIREKSDFAGPAVDMDSGQLLTTHTGCCDARQACGPRLEHSVLKRNTQIRTNVVQVLLAPLAACIADFGSHYVFSASPRRSSLAARLVAIRWQSLKMQTSRTYSSE